MSRKCKEALRKALKLLEYYYNYCRNIIKFGLITPIDETKSKILIIGNGPSAGVLNFDYYSSLGYEFMCVNDFALKKELLHKLKPRYYCCIDGAMYTKKNLETNKDVIAVYDALNEIDWGMIYVCRYGQTPPITNPNIKITHVNSCVLTDSFMKLQFSKYRKNKACSGFQNVICCCLYYAITSNCKDILLTGVEFDMHKELSVELNNDVIREYRHFYGVKRVNITEEGQIAKGEIYKYFYFSYLTLYQYKVLADYCNYMKANVKNLTINSTIDSIPKMPPVNV